MDQGPGQMLFVRGNSRRPSCGTIRRGRQRHAGVWGATGLPSLGRRRSFSAGNREARGGSASPTLSGKRHRNTAVRRGVAAGTAPTRSATPGASTHEHPGADLGTTWAIELALPEELKDVGQPKMNGATAGAPQHLRGTLGRTGLSEAGGRGRMNPLPAAGHPGSAGHGHARRPLKLSRLWTL